MSQNDISDRQIEQKSLFRDRNFSSLFTAHAITSFGSVVTRDAIPFIAVLFLSAQPFQMSMLALAGVLPVLLVALPAGVMIDRLPKKPMLLVSHIARALLVIAIPLAWYLGTLELWHLFAVVFLVTIFNVIYEVADHSLLPKLLDKKDLLSANSKLASADTAAEITASSLTGLLIQTIGGPLVLLIDSVSYVVSAVFIGRVKVNESTYDLDDASEAEEPFYRKLYSGFQIYLANSTLKSFLLTSSAQAFFGAFIGALYIFHLVNTLHVTPTIAGILIAIGGIGGLWGSIMAEKISNQLGLERTMFLSILFRSFVVFLVPMSVLFNQVFLLVALCIHQIIGDFLFVQYFINERTKRQQIVKMDELGRVNSTARFSSTLAFAMGLLCAGFIGQYTSTTLALLIAALGIFSVAIFFKYLYLNKSSES